MKKTFCAVFAVVIFATGLLTGCTSSDPFETSRIVTNAQVYGVQEYGPNTDVYAAADRLAASRGKTGLYTSKSKDEAKILYDKFINKNNYYPKATLTEVTAFSVKEPLGNATYNTDCGLLYFEDKASAKTYFDEFAASVKTADYKHKNGFKDGYEYVICYKLSANRDGNCDWMEGVYLRGNSVLIIKGFSPIGIKDTFCDRVFSSLDLIDPATLNTDKT